MSIRLSEFIKSGTKFGEFYEDERVFVFFGNINFEQKHFEFFPDIEFNLIKQVHGNTVIEPISPSKDLVRADGHLTNRTKLALAIQTADCLPLMVFNSKQDWIMALHAGWRGIENKIIFSGFKSLLEKSKSDRFSVFMGPHIQMESFEVDKDVCDQLARSTQPPNMHFHHDKEKNKYFVNLKKIAELQLQELPIKIEKLYLSGTDTFLDPTHSSFRRQKAPARNWSFIYLK